MATIRRREGRNGAVTWQVVLSVTGPDGQRARPVKSFAKKRDADAWARRMEASKDDGAFVRPSRLTVGEYLYDLANRPPVRRELDGSPRHLEITRIGLVWSVRPRRKRGGASSLP